MKQLFVIYDKKMGTFQESVFISENVKTAIRSVELTAKNERLLISEYPDDFDLYMIGDYDQDTGRILQGESPQFIINVGQLVDSIRRIEKIEGGRK